MSELNVRSALAEHLAQNGAEIQCRGVKISELPIMEHFNLRFQISQSELLEQIQNSVQLTIPEAPNTFIIQDNILCAWLGPDEWVVISPPDRADQVAQLLGEATADRFATFTRLGSAQTIVRISGENAIDFLSRGISVDLHPSVFKIGECAQTVMAHANVMILNHTRDEPVMDIIVRRSYADHLWQWLLDVGEEAEFKL